MLLLHDKAIITVVVVVVVIETRTAAGTFGTRSGYVRRRRLAGRIRLDDSAVDVTSRSQRRSRDRTRGLLLRDRKVLTASVIAVLGAVVPAAG